MDAIWIINVVLFVLIIISLLLYFSVFKKKTKSECEINDDCIGSNLECKKKQMCYKVKTDACSNNTM